MKYKLKLKLASLTDAACCVLSLGLFRPKLRDRVVCKAIAKAFVEAGICPIEEKKFYVDMPDGDPFNFTRTNVPL